MKQTTMGQLEIGLARRERLPSREWRSHNSASASNDHLDNIEKYKTLPLQCTGDTGPTHVQDKLTEQQQQKRKDGLRVSNANI